MPNSFKGPPRTSRVLIFLFISAIAVLATVYLLRPGIASAPDFDCGSTSKKTVLIDVGAGESGDSIARDLFAAGVTKSSAAFFRVAVGDERSARIAPGVHKIEVELCAQEALEQLLDSARISNLLSVIEGAWNSEIKNSLVEIGFKRDAIDRAFSSAELPQGYWNLEGLLFPAQYSFDSATAVVDVLSAMISRGERERELSGISDGEGKFSPQELLIIASLVQAEGDEQDFTKISQVVRNRLKIGMPLQFDSTVHYIKGVRGSVFLSTKSTLINSPYNTYKRYGLPPGPINNPGAAAMYAAAHPTSGDWLYFITVAPGDTRFTRSYDEFGGWKVLYKKNLRDGKFGG